MALIGIVATLTGCEENKSEASPKSPEPLRRSLDQYKSHLQKTCAGPNSRGSEWLFTGSKVNNFDRAIWIQAQFSSQLNKFYREGPYGNARNKIKPHLPKALEVYFSTRDTNDCDTLIPVLELLEKAKQDYPNTKITIFEVEKYPEIKSDDNVVSGLDSLIDTVNPQGEGRLAVFAEPNNIPHDYRSGSRK
jgi:hypothetical protein